ncbi:hypothetical protein DENSPDRAFT_587780 [Dentipellis sp. KUC8613]|nr:hypothetical protein DENSPDRAFT_587780 [Dentipellis sp. KUC8613]
MHFAALIVTIICTVANAFLFTPPSYSNALFPRPQDILERPSTYIGLDKIHYDPADEATRHFDTYPFLLTQISEADPSRVWDDDALQRFTKIGSVSPEIRHFEVTPEVSSIAQFRAVDYGYERCSLHFAFEGFTDTNGELTTNTTLNVWMLDAGHRLQPSSLSWQTRPRRKDFMGTVSLLPRTSVFMAEWECRWGEFFTFELACAQRDDQSDSGCHVELWQNPRNNLLGIFLRQRSSLTGVAL